MLRDRLHAVERDRWPFVGRDDLVDTVLTHLQDPHCDGVFLVGDPGVGTTRIMDEVLRRLRRTGRPWGRIVGSEGNRSVPFAALSHIIPGEVPPGAELDSVDLFNRIRFMLGGTPAPHARFLNCVDDIPLLDDASLGLFTQVLVAHMAIVVATLHADQPTPPALTTIERSCRIRRVQVPPLDRETMLRMMDEALEAPIDGTSALVLAEAAQGRPLFLAEVLDGSIASGALAPVLGTWTLQGAPAVTARLTAVFDEVVAALAPHERDLLELIAFAEPVTIDALEAAGLLTTALALEHAELLVATGGRPGEGSAVRVRQPLMAAQIRTRLSPLRRRSLLPQAIEFIEATAQPPDLLRLALWKLEAGHEVDLDVLEKAAALAREQDDFETTEVLASAAARQDPNLTTLMLQAEAMHDLCRFEEADEVLDRAAQLVVDEVGDLRLTILRHRLLLWGRHDAAESAAVLRAGIDRLQESMFRDFLRVALANTVVFSGGAAKVAGIVGEVDPNNTIAQTAMYFPRTTSAWFLGQVEAAVATGREGLRLRMEQAHNIIGPSELYAIALGMALIDAGSFAEAETVLAKSYAEVVEQHIPQSHTWLALARGRAALYEGRVSDARRWFVEARSVAEPARFTAGLRLALTGLTLCAAQLGDPTTARAAADAMVALPADHSLLWPERYLALAWAEVANGRTAAAVALLQEGAVVATTRDEYIVATDLLFEAARFGAATTVRAAFDAAAARCDGPLVAARVQFVRGAAASDHVAMAAAEKAFARLSAWLCAAEAACELARLLQRAGRPRDAQGALARSTQYLSDLPELTTPMLADANVTVELSPREREIAVLAAQGTASKVIAQQLGLSVRTVSNHLQNAYLKLGISGRDDLADALGR